MPVIVADNFELVQMRWYCGHLQYRARMLADHQVGKNTYQRALAPYRWSEWQTVPAVKGDDSDKRFD